MNNKRSIPYKNNRKAKRNSFPTPINGILRSSVSPSQVFLTNKECLIVDSFCPICHCTTKTIEAKFEAPTSYWLYKPLHYCEKCKRYYLSPSEYEQLLFDAEKRFPGAPKPFFIPGNILLERDSFNRVLYIPKALMDKEKYDRWHLPTKRDNYYDPSDAEYDWIIQNYLPQKPFSARLRSESILGEKGYSVNISDSKRKLILNECIQIHGVEKVLKQLRNNIDWRKKQRNGETRFARAIAIWSSDIIYIENKHEIT